MLLKAAELVISKFFFGHLWACIQQTVTDLGAFVWRTASCPYAHSVGWTNSCCVALVSQAA